MSDAYEKQLKISSLTQDVPYQLVASKSMAILKPILRPIPMKGKKKLKRIEFVRSYIPPLLPEDSPPPPNLYFSKKPRISAFKPYNFEDYKENLRNSPKKLGGLGPSSIGTDDWSQKFKKVRIMKEYSKSVRELNIN